ncbi:ankyrin repeat domain-containing protein [Paludibaculum fermentans]|uniref:Ankyrin repeat domain-containing protein n=1 Tax=Paludibaculum fermentans TaxID=1473598 RepID=A0A7S7NQP9_PALFE|nr:ankyrin repeat domain-containing protein [Paludibaculum fermentans]QOY88036.1 ankyrin repeat domain-containing protein [Paludibaculum fermentans]
MNTTDLMPLPARPSLAQYRKQAKELLKSYKAGESAAVERVKQFHPRAKELSSEEFVLADAQWALARQHGFESWPKFVKCVEALLKASSPASRFEQAVEAVVGGDLGALRRLLGEDPSLVNARSPRVHGAMLLHYVGANGVENYRQKTPRNAVEIARALLDAGAEVDAECGAYGKDTALGLVATSIHPLAAGVQLPLMELLIERGASLEGAPGGWTIVPAALANGRKAAAVYLAERGASLDLEGAAGVGRLDVVSGCFDAEGRLKPGVPESKLLRGFHWACEYGRGRVIEFLLDRRPELVRDASTGMTGLHWAIVGGELEAMKTLIARGAPLEVENQYGGTALGQALWFAMTATNGIDYPATVEVLLAAGSEIEQGSLGWVTRQASASLATRERVSAALRQYGAES